MEINDGATARANFKAVPARRRGGRAGNTSAAYVQLGLMPSGKDLIGDYLTWPRRTCWHYEHGSKTLKPCHARGGVKVIPPS
jgi:hypothetical protein